MSGLVTTCIVNDLCITSTPAVETTAVSAGCSYYPWGRRNMGSPLQVCVYYLV